MPSILDFIDKVWNVTLSTGVKGKPKTVSFPELETFEDEYFKVSEEGITMTALTNGVTTENTKYPRCEFRELTESGEKACWDYDDKLHMMEWTVIVTKLPAKKPDVCIGQIHDAKNDILEIRVEDKKLVARGEHIVGYVTLMEDFVLGKEYSFGISVDKGTTKFHNNGLTITMSQIPKDIKQCYFKVGNYVQSNASKGDVKDFATIILKKAKVKHEKIEEPPPISKKRPREDCIKRYCCCCGRPMDTYPD